MFRRKISIVSGLLGGQMWAVALKQKQVMETEWITLGEIKHCR